MNWLLANVVPALLLVVGRLVSFGPEGAPWANPCGWLVLLLLVVVSATDLAHRRIPNWATYTAIVWGALAQVFLVVRGGDSPGQRYGFPVFSDAVLGFVAGFVVLFLLYGVMGGGAGDVKLAAALGLFLGLGPLGEVLLTTCLLAGLVGGLWVLKCVLLPPAADNRPIGERVRGAMKDKLPMAPFFLAGVLVLWMPVWKGWLAASVAR